MSKNRLLKGKKRSRPQPITTQRPKSRLRLQTLPNWMRYRIMKNSGIDSMRGLFTSRRRCLTPISTSPWTNFNSNLTGIPIWTSHSKSGRWGGQESSTNLDAKRRKQSQQRTRTSWKSFRNVVSSSQSTHFKTYRSRRTCQEWTTVNRYGTSRHLKV